MKKKEVKKDLQKSINQIRLMYMLSALVSIVTIVLLAWFGSQFLFEKVQEYSAPDPTEEAEEMLVEEEKKCDLARELDGVCVESADEENPRLVAIMIENHPDARPQAGLSEASIVYEAPVEANYSRFLAIYTEDVDVAKAGPVRSARPYYLDWVVEYGDPMYMHVGGSPVALNNISKYNLLDINEMTRGWYFWRSKDRFAPHNTYTSKQLWDKAFDDYWKDSYETQFDGWKFEKKDVCEDPPPESSVYRCAKKITVSFLPPTYEAVWKFDSESEQYDRYQTGLLHRDQNGNKIVANTVIVQKVNSSVVDDVGRIEMETVGSGEAIIFQNGHVTDARWEKESRTSRTKWLDKDGNAIGLNPGKIWVEVINGRGSVDFE